MAHMLHDGEGAASGDEDGRGPGGGAQQEEELTGQFCFWDHEGEPAQVRGRTGATLRGATWGSGAWGLGAP